MLYKSLAESASLDLEVSTLVTSTSGCRTLGDLGNTSEVQAGERIIPDITYLDVPLVMGNRPREPIIKAIPKAAKFSWEIRKYRRKTKMFLCHQRNRGAGIPPF